MAQQRGGQARLFPLHIELIGIAARRKKGHGVAGEELKFRVGSTGADGGNVDIALNGFVLQAVDKGHIVHICLKIPHHGQVGKGLVHNDDDVWRNTAFPCRLHIHHRSGSLFCLALTDQRRFQNVRHTVFGFFRHNALDFVGIITGGLAQKQILGVQSEFQHCAVVLIAPGLVEKVRFQAVIRHRVGAIKHPGKAAHHDEAQHPRNQPHPPLGPRHFHPGCQGHDQNRQADGKDHLIAHRVGIPRRHVSGGADGCKVHGHQRAALELLHIHIGNAEKQQNGAHSQHGDPHTARQPEGDQIKQQIDHIVGPEILPAGEKLGDKVAVEPLHRHQQHKGHHRKKHKHIDAPEPCGLFPFDGNSRQRQKPRPQRNEQQHIAPFLQRRKGFLLIYHKQQQSKGDKSSQPCRSFCNGHL